MNPSDAVAATAPAICDMFTTPLTTLEHLALSLADAGRSGIIIPRRRQMTDNAMIVYNLYDFNPRKIGREALGFHRNQSTIVE